MEQVTLFVPGRLCLFGEHSDWAGRYAAVNAAIVPGQTIVIGLNLGIYATATSAPNFCVETLDSEQHAVQLNMAMQLPDLKKQAATNSFFSYVCGVAAYMLEHYQVGGLHLKITKTTLPMQKGFASSAAICVLTAKAFNELYHLHLDERALMEAAYQGELLTPSRCGRMDQACVYGSQPVLMEFQGDQMQVQKLTIGQDLYLVFANLMAGKDTKKILADLHQAYPVAQTPAAKKLHQALGVKNQRLVAAAVQALAVGDAPKLGQLMTQAQQLFDAQIAPCSPVELTAPKLHQVLQDTQVQQLVYGGKGVGSGGDGAVQFVAKSPAAQAQLVTYLQEQLHLMAYSLTIPATSVVKTAVIPLAGLGTRLYPATRFVKKAFLPIVDTDGLLKPILWLQLLELDAAGIQKIILVVNKSDLATFKKVLQKPLTVQHWQKLSAKMRDYETQLARISKKLVFVVQKQPRGFGDAIYRALPHLQPHEPVLLYLGDFVFRSQTTQSCTQQILDAYQQTGKVIVGIKPIALDEVTRYGVLSGKFVDQQEKIMQVQTMVEKPTLSLAQANLGVTQKDGKHYYATFGQYVLTPAVFTALGQEIDSRSTSPTPTDEVDLTGALNTLIAQNDVLGFRVAGVSFDTGVPQAYQQTISAYWQPNCK